MTFARVKSTIKMGFINSIFFFIFFYQSILLLPIVASKYVLYPGDEVNSLDSNSNLVSADGKLTLGFSTIPSTNLTYLGIWNTNIENDYLWVANRDTPIGDGILTIDHSGTLKVVYGGGTSIFTVSNGQIGSGNNTAAVLRDTGNFVVYDASDNNRTIWQSFDHPFDILIPGMKIGYNLTTKQNWTITSRLTDQILASGAFTMRLEQYKNSPQLLIYRRGDLYWASGAWNKAIGTFHFLDAGFTGLPSRYPYNLISDASAMYLIVQDVENSDSTLPLLVLSPNGSFSDSYQETPDFCYGYLSDTSVMDIRGLPLPPGGCKVSAILPHCRAHSDTNLYFYSFVTGFSISGPKKHDDNSSINLSDCKERCWNDCKCTGCSTYTNGTGCITWTGTPFESDDSDEVFSLTTSPPPMETLPIKTPNKKKWILVSMAVLLISALTTFLCYARIGRCLPKAKEKRIRDDFIHQLTGSNSFNFGDELEKGIKEAPDIKIFSLKAILSATKNFSNENKLGEGGYGPVYKGKLFDGREIAVKRLSKTSGQGLEEFKSEMILISKLQHTNLVRLYGCCIHQEEKMLIYEFMPNKSLDFFLFDEDEKEKIDWELRFNIIEGVAHGLLYLHKYSRMKVIHRDMKVSNVLLDVNMNPKIADFGMARVFNQDVAEAMTDRVVGTYGYMAPEYAMEGCFSIKSDVYSFGVLILEIVSGKRNSSFYNLDRPLNLVGYAWELWKGQASLELKDKALGESCDVKQLLRVIHVGLLCVQENANDRPTMSKVISMLNKEIGDLPRPKQPAFFTGRQIVEVRSSGIRSTENGSVSNNGLTVTTMEAR